MSTAPAWYVRDVLTEELDRSGIWRDLSSDQVEQRCFARAIRADDQPSLAGFDVEIDVGRDVKATKRFAKAGDSERAHDLASALPGIALELGSRLRHARRQKRMVPGTRPSGIRITMATKMAPSRKFQRSINPLTTVLTATTSAAPTIGPSRVPAPPEITISNTSAEAVSASVWGLMNCV